MSIKRERSPSWKENDPKRTRIEVASNISAPIIYSFSFIKNDTENNMTPSLLPTEIWKVHILGLLSRDDRAMKALRSSCRGFMFLASQVWENVLLENIGDISTFFNIQPHWPFQVGSICYLFDGELNNVPIQRFSTSLTTLVLRVTDEEALKLIFKSNMNILKLTLRDPESKYFERSCLKYLPTTLTKLNLVKFNLDYFPKKHWEYLPSSLTQLYLQHCDGDDYTAITMLPSSITDLSLEGCKGVTDEYLTSLPPNLKRLDLSGCTQISVESFSYFPTSLAYLEISWNNNFERGDIRHLPRGLKELKLRYCRCIYGSDSLDLPPNVSVLNFRGTSTIGEFESYPDSVTDLDFSNTHINSSAFYNLPTRLTRLDLSSCNIFRNDGLKEIPTTVTNLNLFNCKQIDDISLIILFTILSQSLEWLDLSHCDKISDKSLRWVPSKLKHLDLLTCSKITDAGLRMLPSTLTSLGIGFCKNITGAGLKSIVSTSLTHLDLTQCEGITDDCLKYIPSNLISLDLDYCFNITSEGLENLPTSLTRLHLKEVRGNDQIPFNLRHAKIIF